MFRFQNKVLHVNRPHSSMTFLSPGGRWRGKGGIILTCYLLVLVMWLWSTSAEVRLRKKEKLSIY